MSLKNIIQCSLKVMQQYSNKYKWVFQKHRNAIPKFFFFNHMKIQTSNRICWEHEKVKKMSAEWKSLRFFFSYFFFFFVSFSRYGWMSVNRYSSTCVQGRDETEKPEISHGTRYTHNNVITRTNTAVDVVRDLCGGSSGHRSVVLVNTTFAGRPRGR